LIQSVYQLSKAWYDVSIGSPYSRRRKNR